MRKKQEQPQFKCPNHSKQTLRSSYAYPSLLWCDLCKNAWNPHELQVSKNKQFLILNITDRVTSPDYLCLHLDISQTEIELLTKLKKEREDFLGKYSKNIKNFKFNVDPFLNIQCLQRIKLVDDNKEREEELFAKVKKSALLSITNVQLDLKKCRPESILSTRCEMLIGSSGISFENKTDSDYDHIESAHILWKDLGVL